jgi:protein involved in polysaccharide export with SLBB domain
MVEEARETFAQALTIAKGFEDKLYRDQRVADIAKAQVRAGMVEEALATLKGSKDSVYRPEALRMIALAQAEAGVFSEALAVAQGITYNHSSRDRALLEIGRAHPPGTFRVRGMLHRRLPIELKQPR